MSYLGDYAAGAILDHKFSTQAGDGTPTTLDGSPVVKVYKGNADGTEVTTGVTLTVDFDSKTGLNHLRIDTSDGFYATGNDFQVVITTGTVDTISVVGRVVAEFSIEHRSVGSGTAPSAATVAAAVWDLDATAHQTQGTFGQAVGDPGADADSIWALANTNLDATVSSRLASASITLSTGKVTVGTNDDKTGYRLSATGVDDVWDEALAGHSTAGTAGKALTDAGAAGTPPTAASIADAVFDEALSGHTTAGTAGKALGDINTKTALLPSDAVPTGTIVADAGNSAVTFKTDLTGVVNNYYKDMWCRLTSGVMTKQVKKITASNGTTGFITVSGGYTGIPAAAVTFDLENR